MNESNPMVSVIVLAYNKSEIIDEALSGILSQHTTFPYEIIIAEDCSTDNTLEICRAWQSRFPDKVKILANEKNMGIMANYCNAFSHCSGKYVALCDADDYWISTHKLQRQVDFLESHPDFAICFHRVINYYEADSSKSLSNGTQRTITTIVDLSKSNYISSVSMMVRNHLLPKGALDQFISVLSFDYTITLLTAQFGKIYYIKTPMAVYRKNAQGVWSMAGAGRYKLAMSVRREFMMYFKEKNPEVYNNLYRAYIDNAIAAIGAYRALGKTDEESSIIEDLHKYCPEITIEEVKSRLSRKPQASMKTKVMKVAKQGRTFISRFVPVPHPPKV